MALNINGTTGISGVDGSASAPALQGTDSNTGINFASDTVNINTGGSARATVDSSGNLGIGTTNPNGESINGSQNLVIMDTTSDGGMNIKTGTTANAQIHFSDTGANGQGRFVYDHSEDSMKHFTGGTERMRLGKNTASIYLGKTTQEVQVSSTDTTFSGGVGVTLAGGGTIAYSIFAANNNTPMYICRRASDGVLVEFYQDASLEGNISVSGSTVSYNGGHLSRWSQLAGISETDKSARPEIYQGTVLSNLDELCVWSHPNVLYTEQDKIDGAIPDGKDVGDIKEAAYTENNQQLNKTKVSDTVGDKDVAGVFWTWDDEDDEYVNDFYIAMTGDMVIRVAASTTVARGDLLISAGDGTAKPQADDIVRSSTIAKIISTNHTATYPDGSKAYPCVLMAC